MKESGHPGISAEKWKVLIKYLLDTNICIFFFKGRYGIDEKLKEVGIENCCISVITLAELKFGSENSANREKHRLIVDEFESQIQVLPLINVLEDYAKQKTILRKQGTPIDEFDLLIGCTAKSNNLIVVTNNTKHFKRIDGISIEDWTKK